MELTDYFLSVRCGKRKNPFFLSPEERVELFTLYEFDRSVLADLLVLRITWSLIMIGDEQFSCLAALRPLVECIYLSF